MEKLLNLGVQFSKLMDHLSGYRSKTVIPTSMFYVRYVLRVFILFTMMFVLLWWPVDSFTPDGFERWVSRIVMLPDYMWYLILMIFTAWGVSEAAAHVSGSRNEVTDEPYSRDVVEDDCAGDSDTDFDDFEAWRRGL